MSVLLNNHRRLHKNIKKLFVLTVILLLFYACAGDGESDNIDDTDSLSGNSSSGGASAPVPACNVGDIISVGKSCVFDSGKSTFSVSQDGDQVCVNSYCAGNFLTSAQFSVGDFRVIKQADGTWRIAQLP